MTRVHIQALEASKQELFDFGLKIVEQFFKVNDLKREGSCKIIGTAKQLGARPARGSYGCGYWTVSRGQRRIVVNVDACAKPSRGYAQMWSFPGYTADRTPIGVLAHEMGHNVDFLGDNGHAFTANHGKVKVSVKYLHQYPSWVECVQSDRFSSYEPTIQEAFAETFRLFLLNPRLCEVLLPNRYAFLRMFFSPVSYNKDPVHNLRKFGASDATLAMAAKKVAAVKTKKWFEPFALTKENA